MGYIDTRNTELTLNLADFGTHIYAQFCIEVGQRLIKQHYSRFHNEGTGKCHTLLLSAGYLRWEAAFHTG